MCCAHLRGHFGPLSVEPGNRVWLSDRETMLAKKPTKPSKPQIVRGSARKPTKKAPRSPEKTTKQDQVLALLRRPNGASVAELVEATDW